MDKPKGYRRFNPKVWLFPYHVVIRRKNRKLRLLGHILRSNCANPVLEVMFQIGTNKPRTEHFRRACTPKTTWLVEIYADVFSAEDVSIRFGR